MTTPGPDWVDQARHFLAGSGLADALTAMGPDGPGGARPGDAAAHAAECRWCPLCAGLAALRGRRPDLLEGLADLLTTAATVVRAHAAGAGSAPQEPAGGPAAHPPGGRPAGVGEPTGPVQRIDVA